MGSLRWLSRRVWLRASGCADRRGCWGAVTNGIVQLALSNSWLTAQGVPNLHALWLEYHYPRTPSV